MYSRRSAEAVASLCHGVDTLFRQGLSDTLEGLKGMGAWRIFRARRHLARNPGWAQDARGSIVGGLDTRGRQAPQPIAPVVVATELVQQPLIVGVRQAGSIR